MCLYLNIGSTLANLLLLLNNISLLTIDHIYMSGLIKEYFSDSEEHVI